MTGPLQKPEQILDDLGIRDPDDLDLEAIAEYCGATIRYKPLAGSEARIIGYRDRAIITINQDSSPGRRRFSGGHELGHWMYDREQIAFRCIYENYVDGWWETNPETRANRFASDLLLPLSMFRPRARGLPVTFDSVRKLATIFKMSLTSTAVRLVEHGWLPSMLVFNNSRTRERFVASPDVSRRLWPLRRPGHGSLAISLLAGTSSEKGPADVRCDNWINHPRAHEYWLKENSFVLQDGSVLSLLWWEDEKQLIHLNEYEERMGNRRSDGRKHWE